MASAAASPRTLILPAVSLANICQFGVDLLVVGKQGKELTADDNVTPFDAENDLEAVVSNDSFATKAAPPTGRLATRTEVLRLEGLSNTYALQIRSPVVPGRSRAFAARLMDWVVENKFERLVVLAGAARDAVDPGAESADAVRRFWSSPAHAVSFQPCEEGVTVPSVGLGLEELRFAGLAPFIAKECEARDVPAAFLVALAYDGDGRLPGARLGAVAVRFMDANSHIDVPKAMPLCWSYGLA